MMRYLKLDNPYQCLFFVFFVTPLTVLSTLFVHSFTTLSARLRISYRQGAVTNDFSSKLQWFDFLVDLL